MRQLIGYDRYKGSIALAQMERVGEKVRKRYDVPKTPYRRAMEAGVMLAQTQFESQIQAQGPMALRRRLDAELDRLWSLRVGSPAMVKAWA